ncbi:Hypothetical predicted protein [Mytilus galloprovincialis]|uniref:Uncharacterized protein n=1 Tax=Mytilus galloprovincialis TaxID=29158 RepID=A0A8B6H327_MYTGA|nr:Hypothetical predicted protein [Mytilus galloprovincialis]
MDYDQFQSLIKSEMENKLPVYETDYNRSNKRKKSMFKPYWNDILRDQWNKVCMSERKWLKHSGSNSEKRKLKDCYCTERKQFDRMNRKFKRRYQNNERQKLEDKLYSRICNERKSCIPSAVVNEDGTIETDKVNVLDRWKEDFRQLFNSDENNEETIPQSTESQNVNRDITELNEPITREEVITAVTRAKVRKAAAISEYSFECSGHKIMKIDSYKYLGIWLDEHLTFRKNARELSKSASRALGALCGKVVAAGGMTHGVYTKLYSTVVEPILLYGSGIWGTKTVRVNIFYPSVKTLQIYPLEGIWVGHLVKPNRGSPALVYCANYIDWTKPITYKLSVRNIKELNNSRICIVNP